MNKRFRVSSTILMAPFLMGASLTPTGYSQLLNYQILGVVLQSGSQTQTVNSTRNQLMGTAVLNYELIYNGAPTYANVHRPEWRYYTINYRLDLYPENKVKYANGLGGWFTETGNTAVKSATATITYANPIENQTQRGWQGDVAINTTSSIIYNTFDLCLPGDGNSFYFGNVVEGAKFVYCEPAIVTNNGLKVKDSGERIKIYGDSIDIKDGVLTAKTEAEYVNRPRKTDNRSHVSFYGCYEFTSQNAYDTMNIEYNATFIIAEGGAFGECVGRISSNVGFSWTRPDPFD